MSGNIVSTSSTLNVGDGTSSTVNINSATTLNLGSTSGTVNVRGLPMLFSSTTSNFASITSLYYAAGVTQSWYKLPYSTSQDLLIQWGYVSDRENTNVNFQISYTDTPYMFLTQYNDGSYDANIVINNVQPSFFQADTGFGSGNKSSFNYLAIGLKNK